MRLHEVISSNQDMKSIRKISPTHLLLQSNVPLGFFSYFSLVENRRIYLLMQTFLAGQRK